MGRNLLLAVSILGILCRVQENLEARSLILLQPCNEARCARSAVLVPADEWHLQVSYVGVTVGGEGRSWASSRTPSDWGLGAALRLSVGMLGHGSRWGSSGGVSSGKG